MAATQLERFHATVNKEEPEGFLFNAGFTPDLKPRVLEAYGAADINELAQMVGMFTKQHINLLPPDDFTPPDFSVYFENEEFPEGAVINGIGVMNVPGSMYHFTRYVSPLRNAEKFEEIENFPYPNCDGYTSHHMAAQVEEAHNKGLVTIDAMGHMYESSWQIRGYEEFLMDMVLRPEWCEFILDRLMEKNLARAIAAAEAGVDMLGTGDDVANQNNLMFSEEQWRHFMKPRWAKVYAAAREIKPDIQIWYHSDGNIETIIPDLIEIGVTILNPVQPECIDPIMVKEKYGDKLTIDGAIGTQTTMPFGSVDDVINTVREYKKVLGKGGGYIISPTHILEPEVPVENIKAFFETAAE